MGSNPAGHFPKELIAEVISANSQSLASTVKLLRNFAMCLAVDSQPFRLEQNIKTECPSWTTFKEYQLFIIIQFSVLQGLEVAVKTLDHQPHYIVQQHDLDLYHQVQPLLRLFYKVPYFCCKWNYQLLYILLEELAGTRSGIVLPWCKFETDL